MTSATGPLWRRQGLVLGLEREHPWWVSHLQSPTVLPLSETVWRVYFAARDADNRAHLVAVDLDPSDGMRLVTKRLQPMLERGPPGAFDHAGLGPSDVIRMDGRVLLYYTGVSVRTDVRTQFAIGAAASEDDGLTFKKVTAGPILCTGPFDPYFSSSPTVLKSENGYRMWYSSCVRWGKSDGALEPSYEIRTTTSSDGLVWDLRSQTAVDLGRFGWEGLARPTVALIGDTPMMWFSGRGAAFRGPGRDTYRIYCARVDAKGVASSTIEPVVFSNPPEGADFDSWMQAYPCIVPYHDDLIMFYNGNDFGRAGIGWARLRGGARG